MEEKRNKQAKYREQNLCAIETGKRVNGPFMNDVFMSACINAKIINSLARVSHHRSISPSGLCSFFSINDEFQSIFNHLLTIRILSALPRLSR